MRKRKPTRPAPRESRSGSPWPRRRRLPAGPPPSPENATETAARAPATTELGEVARAVLGALHGARLSLDREPTAAELSARTGLGEPTIRRELARLEAGGLTAALTPQKRACLEAIARLERRLGSSPSTREVSDEMGVAPSTSRFHINGLVALGLVTPPEVRLVLGVTPAGRALLTPRPQCHDLRETFVSVALGLVTPPPPDDDERRALEPESEAEPT